MSIARNSVNRVAFLGALAIAAILLLVSASSASAAGAWRLDSVSNPSAAPGSQVRYIVQAANVGDAPIPAEIGGDNTNCRPGGTDPSKCYSVRATFPAGMTPVSATRMPGATCTTDLGTNSITCSVPGSASSQQALARAGTFSLKQTTFVVAVDPGSSGTLTSTFEVSGPEGLGATTVDSTVIDPAAPEFGVGEFDGQVTANQAGAPLTQAGGHPYEASSSIEFNSFDSPNPILGALWPVAAPKTTVVDLPPGLVGSPVGIDECTSADLAGNSGLSVKSFCPPASQVGGVFLRLNPFGNIFLRGPLPLYNMVPPPGAPARFGFNVLGTVVTLDAEVRSESDYGVSIVGRNTPQGAGVQGVTVKLWGVPSDASHDFDRACSGELVPWTSGITCASGAAPRAFLRNPTECTPERVGLPTTITVDSWQHPGDFVSRSFESHLPPAYPAAPENWGDPQGPDGCDRVPFRPSFDADPGAGAQAGQPSGFSFDLSLPQPDDPGSIGSSDLRKAVVTLPKGLRVNPSSAQGLGACTQDQANLDSREAADCPDNSKIGTVEIETPLLDEPLEGGIFLAKQGDNPFGSLLAVYLTAEGSGVEIGLAGHVRTLADGQLVTTFDDIPQAPVSNTHLEFKGGPRAPLTMPDACGTHTIQSTFTGWSGREVQVQSPFTVNANCAPQGFAPSLKAGVDNPFAGSQSPFALQVKRSDNDQEIKTLDATLPEGLTAVLKGVAQCPESALGAFPNPPIAGQGAAELASPRCPAASQVGKVIVGAGAGSNPFFVDTGKVYLAGPYKGAPLSFAFLTPAVAGPFDLGNVLVRAAAHVDPVTAQVTAKADPLPQVLEGIPLDIRDVRVQMDRPNFTLNPTSCDEMSVDAALTSIQGTAASATDRFQMAECSRLGFKPKLTLSLRGKTNRGAHPALTAVLKPRPGDANLAKISVALPKSEFLDQAHIRTICTRAQFAASTCPRGAIYGQATVTTPLFDQRLTGPVYLRSSRNLLPDLVPDLRGPADLPIRIESAGRVDEINGGIRNTFDVIPDAPFTKLVLRLKGGNKGLLQNSRNICKQTFRATVQMDAQNGKVHDFKPALKADCGKKSKKRGKA